MAHQGHTTSETISSLNTFIKFLLLHRKERRPQAPHYEAVYRNGFLMASHGAGSRLCPNGRFVPLPDTLQVDILLAQGMAELFSHVFHAHVFSQLDKKLPGGIVRQLDAEHCLEALADGRARIHDDLLQS